MNTVQYSFFKALYGFDVQIYLCIVSNVDD
jgi:hypothetical protein